MADLNDSKGIITRLKEDIAEAEAYQEEVIKKAVLERYQVYYADKDYYKTKFPKLSLSSNLVSTDVADTIEWALPALMKIFYGSNEAITIQGVTEEDDNSANVFKDLLVYQLQRKNKFFEILYNWFKDALITGVGLVKCYWEREEGLAPEVAVLGSLALGYLQQSGVQIQSTEAIDNFGNYKVTYLRPYYVKNMPKLENILISEFLYSSDAKSLDEADFVAHRKKVNMSYLRKKEQQGIYANVDDVKSVDSGTQDQDDIERLLGDNYSSTTKSSDKARDKVVIYECYTKIDINNDGILEDMIVTIAEDVILRIEENYMGRHPFFDLSPTKDPHRVWTKRSYAELIGELQDLKVALTRQIMQNVALTNDPKMILSEDAINIDDFVKGRAVIRKKPGFVMNDVAMSMPPTPLHPWTFQFLEYIEGQKESRTGITRYNQGLDAKSLNKMLALDTPIPMADGSFKRNKDIVDGDMVIGSDGKATKVTFAHPVQMPERAFEIRFKNGDVIKAGGEHRWAVKVSDKWYRNKSADWEKLPTERIFDLISSGHNVFVPLVQNFEAANPKNKEKQKIVSIHEIPIEPMRCLTVEAEDELYCCGKRYTLTSNTATGISAIMSASNQRLELIARRFAETGILELYRFLISLNQKFIDQETIIRLTNKTVNIKPDDLSGNFDLVVNAGIGIATKESTMMNLQSIMTALMQVNSAGAQITTSTNVYNFLYRDWETDRKCTRLNSSHEIPSRMPSSA